MRNDVIIIGLKGDIQITKVVVGIFRKIVHAFLFSRKININIVHFTIEIQYCDDNTM